MEELRVKQDYILSDKRLSPEDKKSKCAAIDVQIAELKEVFVEEYAKCKVADQENSQRLKESRMKAKEAAKAEKLNKIK